MQIEHVKITYIYICFPFDFWYIYIYTQYTPLYTSKTTDRNDGEKMVKHITKTYIYIYT